MRTKVTLVLIFLNVALFFFIFKFERNWRTEADSLVARRRVLGAEAADIRSLEVVSSTATGSFSLVRPRDIWSLTKPIEWPANQHAATSIVDELRLLEHETSFRVADLVKNQQSLADYGLDQPKLTVAFSSSDPALPGGTTRPPTRLQIGDTTKDGKRLYILSPNGDRVHVVKRTLADSLATPLEQLRADTLLTIRAFEARSLIVQTGAASSDPARRDVGLRVRVRREGARWKFDAPITAPASKTAVELTLSELNALHAKSFPTTAPGALPANAPALRVMIEGNNRQETLFIGEVVPPSPTAKPVPGATQDPEYYAQLEGRAALFTVSVPPALMEALRSAQESLREKRILDFDPGAVTAVTLAAPLQSNQAPLTLQRLEAPAGQPNVAPSWQIVRSGPSASTGAQTSAADRATVQRLLERLALLSAEKFKSDAPTSADLEEWGFNRPVREVTISSTGNATPVVLRLGTGVDRNIVYGRVGTPADPGTSIYQVAADVLADLPLAPTAWRDRAVAEPLPPTARISMVKLTDLETKRVLAETSFNAAGEPTTPPPDLKAMQAVVAALRALRAKEFVPGGFTERVATAGDDRPWRFQLDTNIAMPGAGGAEQITTLTLFLTERVGGTQQFAGLKELNTVFALEQPFVDALWALAYGNRDPGPRLPATQP